MEWPISGNKKAIGGILFLVFAGFMAEILYFSRVYSEMVAPAEPEFEMWRDRIPGSAQPMATPRLEGSARGTEPAFEASSQIELAHPNRVSSLEGSTQGPSQAPTPGSALPKLTPRLESSARGTEPAFESSQAPTPGSALPKLTPRLEGLGVGVGAYDLVLYYTGTTNIHRAMDMALAGPAPLFISGAVSQQDLWEIQKRMQNLPISDDPRALTTDQNARDSAPYIRQKGYRRVLLVCSWDHLPRALFLTRFYLMCSGVSIVPYSSRPVPHGWWHTRRAWIQLFKFWGSLGRIALHEVGIDSWPPPQWMP